MILFKMAWRNNWRHRWRSVLTIGAIVFGLGITIWGFCLVDGSHEQFINNSVESFSGHLQIHRRGYQADQSLQKAFEPDSSLEHILASTAGVKDWGERIVTFALVGVGEVSYASLVVGIQPERERRFIHWDEKMVSGRYLEQSDSTGCILGQDLADNLGVVAGDTVVLVTNDFYGAMTGALKVVRGTFRAHSPQLDRSGLLLNLGAASEMLGMGSKVSTFVVMTASGENVGPAVASLRRSLDGRGLEVIPWQEILPDVVQGVELDNIFGVLTNAILILVIGFMVLNTFLMGVLERIREFGMLRALGASPARVVGLILLEAAILSGLGFLLADLIGISASLYNSVHPLDFSRYGQDVYKMYGVDPRIYTHVTWRTIVLPNLFVLAIIALALIYPALRAARISPAEAVARH